MRKMLMLGLAAMAVAAGYWLFQSREQAGAAPADGVVVVAPNTPAAGGTSRPAPAKPAAGGALPAAPDEVIDHVRQAYPLLTRVDFSCDTGGCAVTATIPPPTDEAFLAKRQEMLTGGLAKVITADRYQPVGPVQMEEIESNLFRIRLPVTQPR